MVLESSRYYSHTVLQQPGCALAELFQMGEFFEYRFDEGPDLIENWFKWTDSSRFSNEWHASFAEFTNKLKIFASSIIDIAVDLFGFNPTTRLFLLRPHPLDIFIER